MNGVVIAVGCNALAFVTLMFTYIYRQGKTDGKIEQIDKRIDRIDGVLNSKE